MDLPHPADPAQMQRHLLVFHVVYTAPSADADQLWEAHQALHDRPLRDSVDHRHTEPEDAAEHGFW